MNRSLSSRLRRACAPALLAWLGIAATVAAQAAPFDRASTPLRGLIRHAAVCPAPLLVAGARCHARIVVDEAGNARSFVTPSGYGPADLRAAYKISGSGSSSTTIAIVDAYGYPKAEADLATYRSTFGLPACTTANGCFRKVDQNGGTSFPGYNKGWAQETALDLDMASAMCPGCKILLVQANSASYVNLAAAVNTAARLGAHVISNSYGGGESGSTGFESAYDHPGVAITVSTGDSGYGVQFPASSPHVIAVGGTSLNVATGTPRGWTETAWSGAGSGCSSVYTKPSWQSDTGCSMRSLADVSAVADPNTGVAVYGPAVAQISRWMVFGGTSAAAPIIGGVYGVNGGTVTYGSNPYDAVSGLFDVSSGSNGSCSPSYLCTAGTGYDGPTGLGTPNGSGAF